MTLTVLQINHITTLREMGERGAVHGNFGKQYCERILYGQRQNEVYMNTVFQLEIDQQLLHYFICTVCLKNK